MSNKVIGNTLKSRPQWRVPHLLLRISRAMFVASILAIIAGYFWAGWIYKETSEVEGLTEIMAAVGSNPGELLLGIGMFAITVAFYAGILYLISLIVDKVDQLVWLAASDEDRLHIFNQRQKKK